MSIRLGKTRAPKPWTPEQDARLIELREQGYKYADCARIMDMSATTVMDRARALKLPQREASRVPAEGRSMRMPYPAGSDATWRLISNQPWPGDVHP